MVCYYTRACAYSTSSSRLMICTTHQACASIFTNYEPTVIKAFTAVISTPAWFTETHTPSNKVLCEDRRRCSRLLAPQVGCTLHLTSATIEAGSIYTLIYLNITILASVSSQAQAVVVSFQVLRKTDCMCFTYAHIPLLIHTHAHICTHVPLTVQLTDLSGSHLPSSHSSWSERQS